MTDTIKATFQDYQSQYETILPVKLREGLTSVQQKVHRVSGVVDGYLQTTELTFRITQIFVAVLAFAPSIDAYLDGVKQMCKDAKNLTNFAKGVKSIDGFVNFKLIWKHVLINVSGMTLFIVSGLSLIERFNLLDVTGIKIHLFAIPIFGMLPWGGLLGMSIVGLMGMTAIYNWDKKNRIEIEEGRIQNKLAFWSKPLDLTAIQQRQGKYQDKIDNLKGQIAAYNKHIEEGKGVQKELKRLGQVKRLYACEKALEELSKTLQEKTDKLTRCEQKQAQWNLLEKKWTEIDQEALEQFRLAKECKWKMKLEMKRTEKKMALLSIVNCILIASKQALPLVSVGLGYGIVNLPSIVNMGSDAFIAGNGLAIYFMKRSVRKMQIPSVPMEQHVALAE